MTNEDQTTRLIDDAEARIMEQVAGFRSREEDLLHLVHLLEDRVSALEAQIKALTPVEAA